MSGEKGRLDLDVGPFSDDGECECEELLRLKAVLLWCEEVENDSPPMSSSFTFDVIIPLLLFAELYGEERAVGYGERELKLRRKEEAEEEEMSRGAVCGVVVRVRGEGANGRNGERAGDEGGMNRRCFAGGDIDG